MDKAKEKQEFWKRHINDWKQSGISQADYCHANDLSTSSFSKWKKKINPNATTKKYKPKSKYSKFTKLSDEQFETLIETFFLGEATKKTAQKTDISTKTILKTYESLQNHFVSNALLYPHLFFYAGTLLLLAPPPDLEERLAFYRSCFADRKYLYRDEGTEEGALRNNLEMTHQLLINYTSYEWSLAEAFVFRELGFQIYYQTTYALEHNLNSERWDLELHTKLAADINLVQAYIANMNHWATERHMVSYVETGVWETIFNNRNRRDFDIVWAKTLANDLKWALKHNPISSQRRLRNSYWDEFAPDEEAIVEAKERLFTATAVSINK